MAYSMIFRAPDIQDPELFSLCSIQEWTNLSEWVSEQDAPKLTELVEQGEVTDTLALSIELDDLLATISPPEDIKRILEDLVGMLGSGDRKEIASLVDDAQEEEDAS